jgi:transposase InsO family protein
MARTDRWHEFQALFHWHLADQGIRQMYVKPRTPQLNGKVERSHRTDQREFQLLSYTDDGPGTTTVTAASVRRGVRHHSKVRPAARDRYGA